VVLGYGSHLDPGGELAPAIRRALEEAKAAGKSLPIVCSITGTEGDPQQRKKVEKDLAAAGAVVMPTNASAALLAGGIVKIAGEKR
jgi:FdrA protein